MIVKIVTLRFMKAFEGWAKPKANNERYVPEEYEDKSYYRLLLSLPYELAGRHVAIIEDEGMDDAEAFAYLSNIIDMREQATTETKISDSHIQELLGENENEFFHQVETSIFNSPDIGAGRTARVKSYTIETPDKEIPVAIKYLLTPTSKTLSAAAEHDMLQEVERIQTIEEIELEAHIDLIRVPHPYFHHKSEKIQCYGMERIDGADLHEVLEGRVDESLLEDLRTTMSQVSEEKIYKEVETFFEEMHKYCLHGDIKPANIMVSRAGKFYIIDFGQSILTNDISEKEADQMENLKESEIEQTKLSIKMFLKKLMKDSIH